MRQEIAFNAEGVTLRRWFYLPEHTAGPVPTIIMAHGFSAVKEMYLDAFAEVFAHAGFGALVFDNRNFGASDGEPRQEIDPWQQVRDYRHAITYASTLPTVDATRIGIWGSSYSGGHVLVVGAIDRRVRCVVAQVPLISGHRNARRLIRADFIAPVQAQFDDDRRRRFAGDPPAMIPVVAENPLAPCALPTADSWQWFTETGRTRAPAWRNEVTCKESSMYDAIIVGARCAGSALGLLLARRGYRVLLIDRATFPSDMPMSTHFVHQRGVACLARWGLREQVVATQSPPVSRFAIDVGPFTLTGTAPPVDGEPDAFAPHRLLLDDLLIRAAIQSGAELREGCPVAHLLFEDGQVTGVQAVTPRGTPFSESARLVVGADGPASRVAAEVQAAEHHAQPAQQGTAWIYWQDVPLTGVEIYLRDFEGIYAFPSSKGTVVGANWAIDRFRTARREIDASYVALLHRVAPQLAERVAHARRADERLYIGSTRNFFRTAHGPGWVLLGDAHYKKDFCTAQGITDAFCDAERLADAIEQGFSGHCALEDALEEYARQSVEWALPFYELTWQMATFAPPPPDMLALYTALQGNQAAIDRFIGLITEATSPVDFFAPEHVQRLLAHAPVRPN